MCIKEDISIALAQGYLGCELMGPAWGREGLKPTLLPRPTPHFFNGELSPPKINMYPIYFPVKKQ